MFNQCRIKGMYIKNAMIILSCFVLFSYTAVSEEKKLTLEDKSIIEKLKPFTAINKKALN